MLRRYRRLNHWSSPDFLAEVRRALPFAIRKLQTDRGSEFPLAFRLAVEQLGIRYRYITPRCPEQNGKVERSHRIDDEEFWNQAVFPDYGAALEGLRRWEHHYNFERFSLALKGRTPAEKLALIRSAITAESVVSTAASAGAAAGAAAERQRGGIPT